jgi:membrane glycosyltransferase
MGDGTELFRREALHAQTKHLIGEVVLYRPLSFAWLTLVSLVFAAAIIAFLALASYTRKEEKMVSDPNLPSLNTRSSRCKECDRIRRDCAGMPGDDV